MEVILTPGQEHDVCQASTLLADHEPRYVIADKGYDSDEFVDLIGQRGSQAVIPPRSNRTTERRYSRKQVRRETHGSPPRSPSIFMGREAAATFS